MTPVALDRYSTVAEKYDVHIFDVFGVMHNGERANSEAIDVLQHLSLKEKTVCFLTNAPQRAKFAMDVLEKFGIKRSLYQHIFTAGEQVHYHLKKRNNSWHARLGRKCYFIGDKHMAQILADLNYSRVNHLEEADFILAAGLDTWHKSLEDYEEVLQTGVSLSLPMLCGNPDMFVFNGETQEMRAGLLAEAYKKLGGDVFYHGKPYSNTYDIMLKELKDFPREKMLVVGDSVFTDIRGANGANLNSLLISSLATQKELKLEKVPLEDLNVEHIVRGIKKEEDLPTYFSTKLAW